MDAALVRLALDSPGRTLSYDAIAETLGIEGKDVELTVLRMMDAGSISGHIDAETACVLVDATWRPEVTREELKQAASWLDQLESQLTAELDRRKRSRHTSDNLHLG